MALTNEQYGALRRRYDELQFQNAYRQEQRYQEVVQQAPEIARIDADLAASAARLCREGLDGSRKDPAKEMRRIALDARKRKQALLRAHGFSQDYLEPVYVCGACRDTGRLEDGSHCACFKRYAVELFYEDNHQKNQILQENFKNFRTDLFDHPERDPVTGRTALENIQYVLDKAKKFVREFDQKYANLLLWGNAGVGKTFLANCIYKELLDTAHSIIYLTAYELFAELENITFNRALEDGEGVRRMEALLGSELLIIDDLGSELKNSFTVSQLFHIINERKLNKRSTLISTNLSVEDLNRQYGERIFSRLVSDYEFLRIHGDDLRIKIKMGGFSG